MAAFAHLVHRIPGVDEALRILCIRRREHRRTHVAQRLRECDERGAILRDGLLGLGGGQIAGRAVIFERHAFFHDVAAVHHDQVRAFREDERLAPDLRPLPVRTRLLLDGFLARDRRADRRPEKVGGRIDHARHDILDAGNRLERRRGRRSALP